MTVTIRYRVTGITLCAYRRPASWVDADLLRELWEDAARMPHLLHEVQA